jgi:ribosomal-protein-alanine N-acetyltransferase
MDLPPAVLISPNPTAASLRAASARDEAAIHDVEVAAASHPWTTGQIGGTLAADHADGWVIEVDGVVVAHLLASWVADEAEVLTVATHPAHRRRGFAAALLEAAFAAWRSRGVATAWLEVRADNPGAQALYEALGWERFGVRARYYHDGVDALLYRLDLTRAA